MSTEKKVPVSSFDEGIHVMKTNVETPDYHSHYGYALLSRDDSGLVVTIKDDKPCFGELRPYGRSVHPAQSETRGRDYKPSDLPHGFPDGEILAVCVRPLALAPSGYQSVSKGILDTPEVAWALDPKTSPWRGCLTDFEATPANGKNYGSFLWRSTDFGPSIMISLLMSMRNCPLFIQNHSLFEMARGFLGRELTPAELWLVGTCLYCFRPQEIRLHSVSYNLDLSQSFIPNFLAGKPFDLDGGLTLRDRAAYNRRYIHWIFGHNHELPDKFPALSSKPATFEQAWEWLQNAVQGPVSDVMSTQGLDLLASEGR